mgnify:CR=1 FL=1
MNVSLYQAAAAMNATARWQELIAENLATSSVPGARKRDIAFSTVEAGFAPAAGGLPGSRYVIPAATASLVLQQGPLRPTGVATDFAVDGPGFFEVQLPNGDRAYTRDGEFHINAQGQLVTKQGYAVLGDGGPVQFDPNNPGTLTVSATGEISQGGEIRGKLRVVEFAQPTALSPVGEGYFVANSPEAQPLEAKASSIRQGYLEGANISPTVEMASLVTAMRLFEANQRVLQLHDERTGRAITELAGPA